MDYEVHNKNSLSYDIMLSNEVEYTNQLTNMDADNAVDKLLRDVAILKQEVTILEGDIATMKLDVKTHQKDIEMAQGQIRDINTRLGTIDLVIANIQEKLEEKASIEYVDGEVATVEVGVTTNKEAIENINTTLGEEELSTTSQEVKGAINEVLDNTVANTEAIENIDLSQYTKTYKSLTEINPTFTESTPIKDVILAMEDNSMAMYSVGGGVYPSTWGVCTIDKTNIARNKVEYYAINLNVTYTTSYHSSFNLNCEWKALVTQTKTEIPTGNFKNGWQNTILTNQIDIIGDLVTVNIELGVGTTSTSTTVIEGLPVPSKTLDVVGDFFTSSGSSIISNVGRVAFGLNTDGKLFIRSACNGQYVLLNFSYRKG